MTSTTTDVVDLGALTVADGYFLRRANQLGRTPFAPSAAARNDLQHSFTYRAGNSTSREDVVRLIDGARRKVFVASFFIGDAAVREALYRAAERLRGGVYVISAMTEKDLARAIGEADEDEKIDRKIEKKNFEELTNHGIAVRGYEGCHAKFVVVDDRAALVTSANLVTNGLDHTGENGVLIGDPVCAERVARFFAVLWHASRWRMSLAGGPTVDDGRRSSGPTIGLPAPAPDMVGPIWTLHDQHHIKETIAALIGSARTGLVLATYSLEGMVERPDLLLDHLKEAVGRGVTVRLLLRGRNNVASHLADAAALAALGVELYPCSLNHAKGVIADRVRGALFSANFDASHGLDRDVELGMRLDGTVALAEALRYFEHAMAERDLDYARDAPARDLATRIHSYQLSPWPLPAHAGVETGDDDWTWLREVREGPAYFIGKPGNLRIHVGRRMWRLTGDGPARLERASGTSEPAADLLARRLTARRGDKAEPAGICTAILRRPG
jgi:phosphatidylserine/phosphatidylglycerophosphate/cardiolipin synthase-like enzyme